MSHPVVMFNTSDVKSYNASDQVIRLNAIGPRGSVRSAEFLTPDQARDLIQRLQRALDGEGERRED